MLMNDGVECRRLLGDDGVPVRIDEVIERRDLVVHVRARNQSNWALGPPANISGRAAPSGKGNGDPTSAGEVGGAGMPRGTRAPRRDRSGPGVPGEAREAGG